MSDFVNIILTVPTVYQYNQKQSIKYDSDSTTYSRNSNRSNSSNTSRGTYNPSYKDEDKYDTNADNTYNGNYERKYTKETSQPDNIHS